MASHQARSGRSREPRQASRRQTHDVNPLTSAMQSTGRALLAAKDFMRRLMAAASSTIPQQSSQMCARIIHNVVASLHSRPDLYHGAYFGDIHMSGYKTTKPALVVRVESCCAQQTADTQHVEPYCQRLVYWQPVSGRPSISSCLHAHMERK